MRKELLLAGCGVGVGAGLMYVLDPDRGRRRRARLGDRASHVVGEALDTLGKSGRDIGNRARGVAAEAGAHLRCEQVSDEVLAERVRSQLGHAVSEPRDIEVSVSEGRVTLRGIVPTREAGRLLRRVKRVRGVHDVENQLKVKRRRGEAPRPERTNGEGDGARVAAGFSARGRLLATVAGSGLALYGMKRPGVFGAVVSGIGVRLLGRGLPVSAPHRRDGP